MWYVYVTGQDTLYVYGPFDTHGAAMDWASVHDNDFAGRHVCVAQFRPIMPE